MKKRSALTRISTKAVGTELFTDGTGNEDEIGVLTAPETLSGSGTFLNDKTFSGTITMDDVVYGGLQHSIETISSSFGELEIDMSLATEFFFSHDEDIDLVFTNILTANASICILTRTKDSSGVDRFINFGATTINGTQAIVKFSDDATPILSQEDAAVDKFHMTIHNGIINITISSNLQVTGSVENSRAKYKLKERPANKNSKSSSTRQANQEIQVEGATEIGALNVFGSTATTVKSSAVSLIGADLSECVVLTAIDKNSTFVTIDHVLTSDTLTIDLAKSVNHQVLHDRNFSLAFTNLKPGGNYMARVEFIRQKDATGTGTVRNIDWDNTTVNGTIASALWEDGQEVALTQLSGSNTSIMFAVFENAVEIKLFNDYRVGGT